MLSYSFSIFVRGFLAFSGFLVFLVTASLFEAEGRGVIGFGTSIFGSIGTFLSFSLGRVYLGEAINSPTKKIDLLSRCLIINFATCVATTTLGILYWLASPAAQSVLSFNQILAFSLTSFFYVWCHNGQHFYSYFVMTKIQDTIIFITRLFLLFFLGILFAIRFENITVFIWGYSILLLVGTLIEILVLKEMTHTKLNFSIKFSDYIDIVNKIFWPHLDYISFNIFPLLLMVLSASYLTIHDMGRVNFASQIINFIFLLSTTANMRVTAYVALGGIRKRMKNFKILFGLTALVSLILSLAVYYLLRHVPKLEMLESFSGVSTLFLISTLSIPGFALFQFLNPIWIEMNKLRTAAKLETGNLIVCLLISPFVLKNYEAIGFMWLFSIFHTNTLVIHLSLYIRYLTRSFSTPRSSETPFS